MTPKKCSHKTCKRMHTTTFKTCPTCRANIRKSRRKRKRLAVEQTVPDGHRLCTKCCRIQPENQFKMYYPRRTQLTKRCKRCRDVRFRSDRNPNTLKGQCRKIWFDWKNSKTCAHCGSSEAIEADHLRPKGTVNSDYVYTCSDFCYWSNHGGPEALKKELAKCQPLCKACHRIKTQKERGVQTKSSVLRHRKIVNDEKLRVGTCECEGEWGVCGRKVTLENVQAFDWAHRDREKMTIRISDLVYRSDDYFQLQWPIERAKCRLLLSNCHKAETFEENKRII